MNKSGIVIRLIDIVFILLLGFLQISDIIHKDEIKLPPKSATNTEPKERPEILTLEITIIDSDTTMKQIDRQNEKSYITLAQLSCYYLVDENGRFKRIRMLKKLEEDLKSRNARPEIDSLVVIIIPDSNSIVQGTINLIDICRRNGFKRRFDLGID